MKGSVADYWVEFDTLIVSLPKSNDEDLIHAFIYFLKANLYPLIKA